MDNVNRYGRGRPPLPQDSDSSSQSQDVDDGAFLQQATAEKKEGDPTSGQQEKRPRRTPAMNPRPRAGTWNAVYAPQSRQGNAPGEGSQPSLNDTTHNLRDSRSKGGAVDAKPGKSGTKEPSSAPMLDARGYLQGKQRQLGTEAEPSQVKSTRDVVTLTTTSTVTTTTTSTSTNPPSGKMTPSRDKRVPGLNLTTVTVPDPTETPKSPKTSRGPKAGSDLLELDASKLRVLGQGKTSMRLPEFERMGSTQIARSESLAAQLVIGESQWFQSTLNTSKAATMLRGGVSLKIPLPKDPAEKDAENAIKTLLVPFIQHHFEQSKIPEILQEIKTAYDDKIAGNAQKIYRKIQDKSQGSKQESGSFINDPEMKALMEPLTKPLMDFIQGDDGTLRTSGYPAPILNLLVHLADWMQKWQDANSTLQTEEFETARMNALKAFVSTRSFMYDFTLSLKIAQGDVLAADSSSKEKQGAEKNHYTPLLAYMNSSITRTLESFLDSINHASAKDRAYIQRAAGIVESRTLKSDAGIEKQLDESRDKVLSRKPKLTTRLMDALKGVGKDESPASPRPRLKRAGTLNAKMPEPASARKLDKKPSDNHEKTLPKAFTEEHGRELKIKRSRERALREYFNNLKFEVFGEKAAGVPFVEWPEVVVPFISKIATGTRDDNAAFDANPDQVFLAELDEFIRNKAFRNQTPSFELHILQTELRQRVESRREGALKEKEKS